MWDKTKDDIIWIQESRIILRSCKKLKAARSLSYAWHFILWSVLNKTSFFNANKIMVGSFIVKVIMCKLQIVLNGTDLK